MLPTLAVDQFRQNLHVQSLDNEGPWLPQVSLFGGTQTDPMLAGVQAQHFTYWTYVAIRRLAQATGGVFPLMGRVVQRGNPADVRFRGKQRQFIRQHYGSAVLLQSDMDDFDLIDTSHPLTTLLQQPNEDDTWSEFAYETVLFLSLTGSLYWWVIPNGLGQPAELSVLPTQWVFPRYNTRTRELSHYDIRPTDGLPPFELPPEEVICARYKSPLSKNDGWGPLDAAPIWVANSRSIEVSRYNTFQNGLNPDVVVELDETNQDPSPEILDRIKARVMARSSGVRRSGEPLITPRGTKVHKWSHTPREMDFGESANQMRDNNLALLSTPPIMVGLSGDYNRETSRVAAQVYYDTALNPLLVFLAGALTKLAKRFDDRLAVWFDDCSAEDPDDTRENIRLAAEVAGLRPNEARIKLNLEPIDEPAYELGYMAANRVPMTDPADEPPPEEPDDDEPADDPPADDDPEDDSQDDDE